MSADVLWPWAVCVAVKGSEMLWAVVLPVGTNCSPERLIWMALSAPLFPTSSNWLPLVTYPPG